MPGCGLILVQSVTVQPSCPRFVVRRDSEGERDTINPVIDSLVKGRVARAGVDGQIM